MERIHRKALVCDDDPRVRHVVAGLLAAHDYEVVAEVEMATDALRVAEISRPDVVVIDVALMGMSGIEAIPALRDLAPDVVIIVFSSFDSARAEALGAGAFRVIDKTDPGALDDALSLLAS